MAAGSQVSYELRNATSIVSKKMTYSQFIYLDIPF
jgi:hypothetical protein